MSKALPTLSWLTLFILLILATKLSAQTTYSLAEEKMVQYCNNGMAYAGKYDSLQRIPPVLDSCRRFLKRYPNSFAKPNVLSYMLEMTSLISRDKKKIFPLIDSVLYYDKLPGTEMRMGELLIEREIDRKTGVAYLEQALPRLTVPYHRYKTHLLLAQDAIAQGAFASARVHVMEALAIDSVRSDAWYAYLGLCKMREDDAGVSAAARRIDKLLEQKHEEYVSYLDNNHFIGQSLAEAKPEDIDGNIVPFKKFLGNPIVLQPFNFWCGIPEKQFPVIKKLIKQFPHVKFIFLNGGETPEELKGRYFTRPSTRFLKDQTVVFSDEVIRKFFNGRGSMGELLLLDSSGTVRYCFPGMTKDWDKLLKKHIRMLMRKDAGSAQ